MATLDNITSLLPADAPLELRDNNPYSVGSIFLFDEGDMILERDELVFQKSPNDRYYTVENGQSLWSIAEEAYGDSKLYWIIRDANYIDFALDLPVGKTLIIPDLQLSRINV